MKITDRVYLVGSGKFGMQLSHDKDCNIYIVDCSGEYALIDSGTGIDPEAIVHNAENDGIDFRRVSHLLLTHAHGDHAAGANFFHTRYGMKVIAAAEAVAWVEEGDMVKTSLTAAIAAGVYPQEFQFLSCPVARAVRDNDVIQIGDVRLQVLETPGHSRGHISFLWEKHGRKLLFSGDTVFAGGKVVIQNIWDCFIQEYADSIAKINRLGIDSLFAGHGAILLNDAYKHVEQAHQCFARLEIPPNLS